MNWLPTKGQRKKAEALAAIFLLTEMDTALKNEKTVLRWVGFTVSALALSIAFAYAQKYATNRLQRAFGLE